MRKYEVIWNKIKEAKPETWVIVSVAHAEMIPTIVNMVRVEKCTQQVSRRKLELPGFGRMEVNREPEKKRVSFRLINSGDSF